MIGDEGLVPQWLAYSTDRRWGRARELFALEGIRVGAVSEDGAPGTLTP